MCGRYVRKSTRREIARWFDAEDDEAQAWDTSYNVAPQSFQPVIRLNRKTGAREIVLMRWGLVPYWSKDTRIGLSTINARAESVATAPAFREALRHRRCLVPANAFYEWQKLDPKHKQPFAIALTSGEPYGFAGLWERWKDPATRQGLETFSIVTTDSNDVVAPLHNRMPAIIERKDYARWLGEGPEYAKQPPPLDLLRPFPGQEMTAWRVDSAVGNARNDSPELFKEKGGEKAGQEPAPGLFS